ncbi:DUF4129 domain-containing protein [Nocardioides bruguierae]|uniref:DUF4129 domain-containing protein n=1 Tax=Nocardioides bruguierae TaxID=2945102 RepID=UPI00201FE68E|nr:DUF4129 domain-containing protein [Nocardioides bruguierae]MCL8025932.1 DUF4129 domain-containing protein [Nocardioides bruguierae]
MSETPVRAPSLPRARRRVLVGLAAGLGALLLLAVLVGTASGPVSLTEGTGPTRVEITFSPDEQEQPVPPPPGPDEVTRDQARPFGWVAVGVLAGSAFGIGMFLLALWAVLRDRHAYSAGRPASLDRHGGLDDGLDEDEVLERARAALVGDHDARVSAVLAGDARGAVLEAWGRVEAAVAAAGVPRLEWQTTTELAESVLDRLGVDEQHLRGLAGLYLRARWSTEEVGEGARAAALVHLQGVQDSLSSGRARRGRAGVDGAP